jgi:hypothetical protein
VREQQCLAAHTRRSQRGLGARVATADDDHIKFLGVQHANNSGAKAK